MKVLAIVLLCAFAAVQGRSAVVSESKAVAALGENPWLLHLRIATSTSGGFLHTCGATLISETWALSAAECVQDARFIWVRYGVVNVPYPELVTETSRVSLNSDYGVALVDINRVIEFTDNISPVSLVSASSDLPEEAKFCGFGSNDADGPGEVLECFNVSVEKSDDGKIIASSDSGSFSRFDIGVPLVADGVQIGILIDVNEDGNGLFATTNDLLGWIEQETGIELSA